MIIKTAKTDDYIILPNPNHPMSDFRQNNKGEINITGNTNHGAGVKARRGLLRGSGKAEDIDYLFDTSKFTEETAREWLDNYKEKSIMKNALLNKDFKFTMPLIKGYDGDDGYYHIQFGLSTTVKDLQNDEISDKGLDGMVEELKKVQIAINDGHNHKLKDLIGPTTTAWREGTDMFVDLKVRKMWEEEIKDLITSGTPLGGSIEGKATKSIISKDTGKPLIDGVKLYGGALTDIPAAWNLRGSAREKTCTGSLCGQLKKSLGIEKLEGNNVKKSVINVEEAYESIRDDINEALDKKYGQKMEGGWIDRKCYLRYTMPDSIVISTYSGDLYQIPYTRDTSMEDEVQLGDPVPATNQIVTKMIEKAAWILKSNKPNGGGNLTKTEETIPEGMDEKFVDKIKTLGDEGKQFLKGLLGVDDPTDPEGEPGDPGGNLETGGVDVNKTMMSKEDVQKMLDERDSKFEKTLKEKDEKIECLEKTVNTREDTISKQEHGDLVSKAIKKTNDLGFEDIKNEEDLLKHLREEEEFTDDELEKDPDGCIKTAMRGWKIAAKRTPAGSLPNTSENEMQKIADKHAQKATEIRKSLAERGTK
jgi:hypothetical protein